MKILAVSYLFPNKFYPTHGIFVLNRLKAVSKYCDVKVINPIPCFPFSNLFGRYKNYDKIPKKEIIDGIEVYHPKFFIIPRYLKFLDAFTFAASVVPLALKIKKKYDYKIIDLHWTYPDILSGYLLSLLLKKKFLVTIRGKEALNLFASEDSGQYYEEKSMRSKILSLLLSKADFIITLSKELKNICVAQGINPNVVKTITNGVNNDAFYYKDKKQCRSKLDLPQGRNIILSVGSLIYGKGFDRIIRILPKILDHRPDTTLCIIGSEGPAGAYKNELMKLIERHGLEKHVNFVGTVDNADLPLWYNSADLFCLASRGEGSPNVLSEALACGCPAVSTDVGSVTEIMTHSFMGIVVPNDTDMLLNGIVSSFSQQYDRQRISYFMRQYDWDWCAFQVVNIYYLLLNKSKSVMFRTKGCN